MSILVGTKTALSDDPQLTARLHSGSNPTRVVLDRNLSLPSTLNIFNDSSTTIVFTEKRESSLPAHVEVISVAFNDELINSICSELHTKKIVSCIIEGGANTIDYWIKANLWDEARVFLSSLAFGAGIKAPTIHRNSLRQEMVGQDTLFFYSNKASWRQ